MAKPPKGRLRKTNRDSITSSDIVDFFTNRTYEGKEYTLEYHKSKTNRWYTDQYGHVYSRRKAMDMYIAANTKRFGGKKKYNDFYKKPRKTNRAHKTEDGYMLKIFIPDDYPNDTILPNISKYAMNLSKKSPGKNLVMLGGKGVIEDIYPPDNSDEEPEPQIVSTKQHIDTAYDLMMKTFIEDYYTDMTDIQYLFLKWHKREG